MQSVVHLLASRTSSHHCILPCSLKQSYAAQCTHLRILLGIVYDAASGSQVTNKFELHLTVNIATYRRLKTCGLNQNMNEHSSGRWSKCDRGNTSDLQVLYGYCHIYIYAIYAWKQRMEVRPSERRSDARTGIDTARQRQPSKSTRNESYIK